MAEDYMRRIASTAKFANIFKTLLLMNADEADQEKQKTFNHKGHKETRREVWEHSGVGLRTATGKSAGATGENLQPNKPKSACWGPSGSHRRVAGTTTSQDRRPRSFLGKGKVYFLWKCERISSLGVLRLFESVFRRKIQQISVLEFE
jgi:hypothetical protein